MREGEAGDEKQSRGAGTISFLLSSFWWGRLRTLLNVTGVAKLNWPETVLISVGEKLWFFVFQSDLNHAAGTCWVPSRFMKTLLFVPS